MSEEDKTEEVQMKPGEEKARKNGWKPQDEYSGNPEDWVDWQEYNVRGEMIGRISEQSSIIAHLTNKVDERDKALEDMQKLQSTIADREYKRALETLKKQKASAVEDGDGEKVVEIDEDIADLKAKQKEIEDASKAEPAQEQTPQELAAWLSDPDNSWYRNDPFLRSAADGIAIKIKQTQPNISNSDLLKEMEKKIKEELPQHFGKKQTTTAVDDGGGDVTKRQRAGDDVTRSYSQLNDEEKQACDRFVKLGLMTRKEYIESLDGV